MNPSAQGWIKKLRNDIPDNDKLFLYSLEDFYDALRACGFIYGSNLHVVAHRISKQDLTEEECCKVNLCLSFLHIYHHYKTEIPFVDSVIGFYNAINALKTSIFDSLLSEKKTSEQLEKIIHKRVQIDANVLTKNFNYFIVNALLYIDVLAYKYYLKHGTVTTDYLKHLEAAIAAISLDVLLSKKEKNAYDESLIKLFESSLRYQGEEPLSFGEAVKFIDTPLKKFYILDLACMASWGDNVIDEKEHHFLKLLGRSLELPETRVELSIKMINAFYKEHKDNIALLSSKNIVQSFYDNSSKMVVKLITRNSKRLYRELRDSKELMVLLTQSTVRDLNPEEQKKVQEQLLDIFKSIPSLAIFMLPGGALLLPLVIKFIPKLLPSAFDENRINEE
ncbi:LETM1-related biofilm-associated protein [Gaetbulibacter aestuarii]|uniref:LETM1-related biofilm-associated protein n=1 Tax=Gaetbulibacter aestuarii TaxID=1502358 RepID=A0ABW7MXJ3_9FLAO